MAQGFAVETVIYVDGYNLYYGCLKHTPYKWLDLKASIASNGQQAQRAQQSYHRALTHLYGGRLRVIKGYYSLEKARLPVYRKPPDKTQGVDVWRLEEKQTDVNMALEIYRDVAMQKVDQVVLVSNDTDLFPVLEALREDFGTRPEIGIIIPIRVLKNHRPGNASLSSLANWTRRYITDNELKSCQLPSRIPTEKKPIEKPSYW
ncbi:MAG: NYN domain-containing protein [Pseudohongiellaceae bacterium]